MRQREQRLWKSFNNPHVQRVGHIVLCCAPQAKQKIAARSALPVPPPPLEERMSREMLKKLRFWKAKTQTAEDVDIRGSYLLRLDLERHLNIENPTSSTCRPGKTEDSS